jgi:hypothetical protein
VDHGRYGKIQQFGRPLWSYFKDLKAWGQQNFETAGQRHKRRTYPKQFCGVIAAAAPPQ